MYRVLQRKLLVFCRGLRGDVGIKSAPLKCAAARAGAAWLKKPNKEASPQWSKTVVSTTKAVLFLPARTCTPPNYGKARLRRIWVLMAAH